MENNFATGNRELVLSPWERVNEHSDSPVGNNVARAI